MRRYGVVDLRVAGPVHRWNTMTFRRILAAWAPAPAPDDLTRCTQAGHGLGRGGVLARHIPHPGVSAIAARTPVTPKRRCSRGVKAMPNGMAQLVGIAALVAVAWSFAPMPSDAASALTYQPGKRVRATLETAQAVVPYPIEYPAWLPPGTRLGAVYVAFPPGRRDPRGIAVWLVYSGGVIDVADEPGDGPFMAPSRRHGTIRGRPAILAVNRVPGQPDDRSVAIRFPRMTLVVSSQVLRFSTLVRIAASARRLGS